MDYLEAIEPTVELCEASHRFRMAQALVKLEALLELLSVLGLLI
jgi:hypothetical protein